MKHSTTITLALSALLLAAGLTACSTPAADQAASAVESPTAEPTRTPDLVTELPEWAAGHGPWIIYPHDFKCYGTEGCGNDFRALFGEPGWPLPPNTEYYGGPITQEWIASGFRPKVPGEEGWWSEEDLRRLTELGYPTELPLAPVE